MIAVLAAFVLVLAVVLWRRRSKGAATAHPLAGIDSGVRSPFRTPGRIRHRRGF
jgi:hypothetical protein